MYRDGRMSDEMEELEHYVLALGKYTIFTPIFCVFVEGLAVPVDLPPLPLLIEETTKTESRSANERRTARPAKTRTQQENPRALSDPGATTSKAQRMVPEGWHPREGAKGPRNPKQS
ncbi:hypothetical protein R3P38DRAFT_2812011 [Favolaschia claudopus]|uniref:Uncharacterized protein n=1 Tax=Favolaschia claudopus TaxID=2862362 RepID=A0AAV9Z8S2_9AGAR